MKNIALFFATCLALISLASMAGCHHFKNMMCSSEAFKDRIEMMTKKVSKELDLTSEQKNQLNVIKDELIVKLSEQKKHRVEMLTVIREEIRKDSIDQQRLKKLFDDRKQSGEEMHKFLLQKFVDFHAMLTKEQRSKLNVLIEKMGKQCIDE
jgi:protein CpxP